LLDEKGTIKLADFGASKHLSKEYQRYSFKGTPPWMAPEAVSKLEYSFASDIWSLGCTVIEMITGKQPFYQEFKGLSNFEIVAKIGKLQQTPSISLPESTSLNLVDFIKKCLDINPKLRPTCDELLQHPFIVSEIVLTQTEDEEDEWVNEDETHHTNFSSCNTFMSGPTSNTLPKEPSSKHSSKEIPKEKSKQRGSRSFLNLFKNLSLRNSLSCDINHINFLNSLESGDHIFKEKNNL
jgi:serine/threonine protein kinase